MEDVLSKHEENIAKILDRVVSFCKQANLIDLAKKGEDVLKSYQNAKKLR